MNGASFRGENENLFSRAGVNVLQKTSIWSFNVVVLPTMAKKIDKNIKTARAKPAKLLF